MTVPNFPSRRFAAPIVKCTIGKDEFTPADGLMEARVFLGEGERQSNCSFMVYDPRQEWANKYMKASYEQGGIEGLPPKKESVPLGAAAAGGGDFNKPRSQATTLPAEVRAWLDTIAHTEGTSGPNGWKTQFTGKIFTGNAHPREILGTCPLCSDAAGRYQFLSTTWDSIRGTLGLPDDMNPIAQDLAANELIKGRLGTALYNKLVQGSATVAEVSNALSPEWVSLWPGGAANQGFKQLEEITSVYQANLAHYKGQPQVGGTPAAPTPTDNKPIEKIDLSKIPDKPAEKEISNKGQLIKIELGTDPGNMFEFVFTHIATAHQIHLNSTEFQGASIRWEMNRRLKNSAYQEITLKQLASSIAANYGLKLECPEDGPKFTYVDQTGISDYELLRRECDRVGWRIYEKAETLVIEPRKTDQQYLTLVYGEDISKFRCEDRAQTDSAEEGRDFAQLSQRSDQAEAKAKIDPQRGEMVVEKPESKTAKGDGAIAATTGANVAPVAGKIETPTTEKKPLREGQLMALEDVKLGADSNGAKRVKAFKSTIECPTTPAMLGLNPDKPILTEGFPGDFFNRMWVVGSLQHLYTGSLNTTIQLYTPLKPKPGITLGDSKFKTTTPGATVVAEGALAVPYLSQRDNLVQPDRTCNTSSNAMAALYLGATAIKNDDDYWKIVQKYGDTTDHGAQTQALREIGIKSSYRTNLDFADLDAQLERGKPIVIGILHRGTETAPAGGHIITVIGKTKGGDYIVHDPYGSVYDNYTDPSKGANLVYTRSTLQRRWTVEGPGTGQGRIFE